MFISYSFVNCGRFALKAHVPGNHQSRLFAIAGQHRLLVIHTNSVSLETKSNTSTNENMLLYKIMGKTLQRIVRSVQVCNASLHLTIGKSSQTFPNEQ